MTYCPHLDNPIPHRRLLPSIPKLNNSFKNRLQTSVIQHKRNLNMVTCFPLKSDESCLLPEIAFSTENQLLISGSDRYQSYVRYWERRTCLATMTKHILMLNHCGSKNWQPHLQYDPECFLQTQIYRTEIAKNIFIGEEIVNLVLKIWIFSFAEDYFNFLSYHHKY